MGTGHKEDLFITDAQNNLLIIESWEEIPKLPGQEVWISKQLLDSIHYDDEERDDEF